jgi:hypothetical protein
METIYIAFSGWHKVIGRYMGGVELENIHTGSHLTMANAEFDAAVVATQCMSDLD